LQDRSAGRVAATRYRNRPLCATRLDNQPDAWRLSRFVLQQRHRLCSSHIVCRFDLPHTRRGRVPQYKANTTTRMRPTCDPYVRTTREQPGLSADDLYWGRRHSRSPSESDRFQAPFFALIPLGNPNKRGKILHLNRLATNTDDSRFLPAAKEAAYGWHPLCLSIEPSQSARGEFLHFP